MELTVDTCDLTRFGSLFIVAMCCKLLISYKSNWVLGHISVDSLTQVHG